MIYLVFQIVNYLLFDIVIRYSLFVNCHLVLIKVTSFLMILNSINKLCNTVSLTYVTQFLSQY